MFEQTETGARWARQIRSNCPGAIVRKRTAAGRHIGYSDRIKVIAGDLNVVVNLEPNVKKGLDVRVRAQSNLRALRAARRILREKSIRFRTGYRSLAVAPMFRAELERLIEAFQTVDALDA